jgi:molecular chaperone Hsp33
VLANLDAAELNDMIEKDHGAEAYCSFCGKIYTFTEDDLRNMLNRHG